MSPIGDDGDHPRIPLFAVELLLVLAAVVSLRSSQEVGELPPAYFTHTQLLGGIAAALLIARLFVNRRWTATVALVVEIILWYLLVYPTGSVVFPHFMIATAILIDAWSRRPVGYASTITAFLIATMYGTMRPRVVYGRIVSGRSWDHVLFFVVLVGVVATYSMVLRSALRTSREAATAKGGMTRAIEHLTDANVGYQRRVHDIAETSKQEERNRITRDIHDSIGYTVANVIVMIDAAIGLIRSDPDRATGILSDARKQADRGHVETRRTLHILRALEESDIYGVQSIRSVVETFASATGVRVILDTGNLRVVYDGMVDSAIYRFVQEGMTNAFRHGNADEISIRMFELDNEIAITIRDNGGGANHIVEGIGLIGMRERMSRVGGTIAFQNTDLGFQISARIPAPPREGPS